MSEACVSTPTRPGSPSPSTAYSYAPLDASDAIRIITLLPAQSFEAPIHCQIRRTTFFGSSYEALSYAWGSNYREISIKCNDQDLFVTPNLLRALKRLRPIVTSNIPNPKPVTLWVDAICIDQENQEERAHQVSIMKHVYQRAVRVIVYLGEDVNFKDAAPSIQMLWLLDSPWYNRMWTLQESLLNANTIVTHGETTLSLEALELGFQSLPPSFRYNAAQKNAILRVQTTRAMRLELQEPQLFGRHIGRINGAVAYRLSRMLSLCQYFECGDPRDKVFAILGLVDDLDSITHTELNPDYSTPVAEIYRRFAWFIITRQKSLRILHDVGITRRLEGLPSWVPDWSVSNPEGKLSRKLYRPRPDFFDRPSLKSVRRGDGWILICKGFCFDTVATCITTTRC
ncbi:HET-domain-containing protein [Lophium mytilinum]|uniref:HET-domain-containing protein n=1 Tax=Lophium mytilinum TaxID=390894 RepID=A0A6A6QFV6_9PEZI|nr:HET-domain-containing protein [Lophium mytilinum]